MQFAVLYRGTSENSERNAPSDLGDEDVQWAIKEARTTADEIDGLREKAWKYDELCK